MTRCDDTPVPWAEAIVDGVYRRGGPERETALLAVGVGFALNCGPCLGRHVERAIFAGATRQDLLDTARVAAAMRGGRDTAESPPDRLLAAMHELGL